MHARMILFIIIFWVSLGFAAPAENESNSLVNVLRDKVELTPASVDNIKVQLKKEKVPLDGSAVVLSFYCKELKGQSKNCNLMEAYPVVR